MRRLLFAFLLVGILFAALPAIQVKAEGNSANSVRKDLFYYVGQKLVSYKQVYEDNRLVSKPFFTPYLYVFDPKLGTHSRVTDQPVGRVIVAPDGKVYYGLASDEQMDVRLINGLYVYDPATGEHRLISNQYIIQNMKFGKDGNLYIFSDNSSNHGDLVQYNPKTNEIKWIWSGRDHGYDYTVVRSIMPAEDGSIFFSIYIGQNIDRIYNYIPKTNDFNAITNYSLYENSHSIDQSDRMFFIQGPFVSSLNSCDVIESSPYLTDCKTVNNDITRDYLFSREPEVIFLNSEAHGWGSGRTGFYEIRNGVHNQLSPQIVKLLGIPFDNKLYYSKAVDNQQVLFSYDSKLGTHTALGRPSWMNNVNDYIDSAALYAMETPDSPPVVDVVTPTLNQLFSNNDQFIIPVVRVSDDDNDSLTATYFVDAENSPRDSKAITNTVTPQMVSFRAMDISALTEGVHTIRVNVNDGTNSVSKTIQFIVDRSSPTLGDISYSVTNDTITVSGTASDRGSGLNALPYRYTLASTKSGWMNQTSYSHTGLASNTQYLVNFEARDNAGNITMLERQIFTKAQIPSLNIHQAAESSLEISITDNNPASTPYQIKVGTKYAASNGALTAEPTWITLSNKKIKVVGLQAGTVYNIQAAAINKEGTATNWSSAVTGTTIANPPANITTSRTQTAITLNWSALNGASRYDVEVDGIVIANGTAVSYTHAGLSPNTRHTYRVRTVNAGGISKWSAELQVFTLPNPPETPNDVMPTFEQTYITLNWNSAVRAERYEVEVDGTVMNAGNRTTYSHAGLQPDTLHVYRVRATNIGGSSAWSEPLSVTTWPDAPPTPVNVTAKPLIRTVTVTWDKEAGATGYEIEADGFIIDNGNKTQYTDEGLEALTGHTYRVRAKNIGGKSAWSDPVDITTHPEIPTVPTNLMATSEESSITVTWYEVPHTVSYDVEIDGATIVNVSDIQFEHPDLNSDSRHTYRVRAKNISGDSEWSSLITMATLPSGDNSALSLTNIAAIVTNTFITLSWDTVAPNAQYDIEVDGILMDNGGTTIYNHTGLSANEFHTYRIRVKDQERTGDWVAILSLSTLPNPPDSPTNIQAIPTINSIELRWKKVEGATGYDVEIDGKTISVGADGTYLHEDLASGTAHTYRIRAKNVTGVTAWSPSIVQSTNNPTYLINGTNGVEFNLSLFAYNVQDFSELTYVITYNPNEMEVVDLYQFTPQANVSGGEIPGSPLEATYVPGHITFKVNRNVVPGTSWSGEISSIVFKSKVTGQSPIDVVVESYK